MSVVVDGEGGAATAFAIVKGERDAKTGRCGDEYKAINVER